MAAEDTRFRVRQYYQRSLAPGETIYEEGEPGEHFYVVQSGEVELVRMSEDKERVVARLGPGDFFGELSAVMGERRSSRAVAVNSTRLIALDRETLESMCLEEPVIAMRLIRSLVARLIEAERRLAALGVDDLMQPVVNSLLRFGEPEEGGGLRVAARLAELAEAAGLSMRDAHRALHQLFDRKLLLLEEDVLHVPDHEALSRYLDA